MAFATASISNVGGRAVNEDHCGYLELSGAGCWVVADGLGGHGGGATASGLAVDAVLSSFRANPKVTPEALWSHIAAAHASILQRQGEPTLGQMRSTIVVLLANDQRAICGYMGDSRLYQFRNGAVEYQTVDHSVPGALAASGSIQVEDIRFHEDRNRVLRSLGNEDEINPAIVERPLRPGDSFLLCTDGFWEYVTELEMQADAVKTSTPDSWLHDMASRLLHRAKPENDNWTAMAIDFRSLAAPVLAIEKKHQPMGLMEKLSWAAVVCLAVTLLGFLAVALRPERVEALLEKPVRELSRKENQDRRDGSVKRGETVKRQDATDKKPKDTTKIIQ